jgi:hypothetical protein
MDTKKQAKLIKQAWGYVALKFLILNCPEEVSKLDEKFFEDFEREVINNDDFMKDNHIEEE